MKFIIIFFNNVKKIAVVQYYYLMSNPIFQVLEIFDFNKKHKAVGLKSTPLIYILRLPKSQLDENTCRNNILETVYQLILEYSANESHKMYFPELHIPCIIRVCIKKKTTRIRRFGCTISDKSISICLSAESVLKKMPRSSLL